MLRCVIGAVTVLVAAWLSESVTATQVPFTNVPSCNVAGSTPWGNTL